MRSHEAMIAVFAAWRLKKNTIPSTLTEM
jgi:hypothetical protein